MLEGNAAGGEGLVSQEQLHPGVCTLYLYDLKGGGCFYSDFQKRMWTDFWGGRVCIDGTTASRFRQLRYHMCGLIAFDA
jgi:hypothetical protein